MADWSTAETNKHQDHVIAHIIGATPLGHFVSDETAYFLLDIGFIWNIYLDMEMGLLPHPVAIAELETDEATRSELRSDVDRILSGDRPRAMTSLEHASPIESVEMFEAEAEKRLVLSCEEGSVVIETSVTNGQVRIRTRMDADDTDTK
jgi:hypothetical protein